MIKLTTARLIFAVGVILVIIASIYFLNNITGNAIVEEGESSLYNSYNEFIGFYRECSQNCPRQCPTCEYSSTRCIQKCEEIAYSTLQANLEDLGYTESSPELLKMGDEDYLYSMMNKDNLNWYPCFTGCQDSTDKDIINYECLQSCR